MRSDNSTSAICTSQENKENLLPQEDRDGKIQHSKCKRYDFLVNNTSTGCGEINNSDYIIADCNKWAYDDNLCDETIVYRGKNQNFATTKTTQYCFGYSNSIAQFSLFCYVLFFLNSGIWFVQRHGG